MMKSERRLHSYKLALRTRKAREPIATRTTTSMSAGELNLVPPSSPAVGSARLRIAQVAPLAESVPPARYGGTERVVAYLSEALIALGHEVTLFASGDSTVQAPLIACCEASLREHGGDCDGMMFSVLQLRAVRDGSADR